MVISYCGNFHRWRRLEGNVYMDSFPCEATTQQKQLGYRQRVNDSDLFELRCDGTHGADRIGTNSECNAGWV